MSDNELKPCPFCGGKVELIKTVNDGGREPFDMYHVECVENKSSACHWLKCTTTAEAIDDWNTRPRESALEARIAELEAELEKLKVSNSTGLKAFAEEVAYGEGTINPQCCDCRKEAAKALEGTSLALEKLSDEELQAFDDQTARWESQLDQMRAGFEDMKRKYAILEHNNAALKSMLQRPPDVRKLVKPIVWGEANYTDEIKFKFEEDEEKGEFHISCRFREYFVLLGCWYGNSKEAAIAKAQEWLENFIDAACGQEVQNG